MTSVSVRRQAARRRVTASPASVASAAWALAKAARAVLASSAGREDGGALQPDGGVCQVDEAVGDLSSAGADDLLALVDDDIGEEPADGAEAAVIARGCSRPRRDGEDGHPDPAGQGIDLSGDEVERLGQLLRAQQVDLVEADGGAGGRLPDRREEMGLRLGEGRGDAQHQQGDVHPGQERRRGLGVVGVDAAGPRGVGQDDPRPEQRRGVLDHHLPDAAYRCLGCPPR